MYRHMHLINILQVIKYSSRRLNKTSNLHTFLYTWSCPNRTFNFSPITSIHTSCNAGDYIPKNGIFTYGSNVSIFWKRPTLEYRSAIQRPRCWSKTHDKYSGVPNRSLHFKLINISAPSRHVQLLSKSSHNRTPERVILCWQWLNNRSDV